MKHGSLVGLCLVSQLPACSSSSIAEPVHPSAYECAHGQILHVHNGEEHAKVDFLDRHYELARNSSGLGLKYSSDDATLVIDGDSAVFVDHRSIELQTCRGVRD